VIVICPAAFGVDVLGIELEVLRGESGLPITVGIVS
jgi:hypothetical protein